MADTPRVTVPVEPTALSVCRAIAPYLGAIEQNDWSGLEDDDAISMPVKMRVGDLRDLKAVISAAPAPEGGAKHYGDPCVKCGVGHDDVPPGPCRGDGITISRERATEILDYLKKGSGPAGWPTTLWCEVQAFIANIEAALVTREEAPAEAGENVNWKAEYEAVCGQTIQDREAIAKIIDPKAFVPMEDVIGMRKALSKADAILALRAQPQAREDAQPVAYDARKLNGGDQVWVRATVVDPCTSCCAVSMKTVHGTIHPLIRPEDVSITHPAPDALEQIDPATVETAIGGAYDMPDGRKFWIDAPVAREMTNRVLAALQAEQGAK